MTDSYAGGVAVITGAASGIGKGIARAAAARGMRLVLADIAAEPLHAFAAELAAAGIEVLAVPTDVSEPAALDRLADAAYERFGSVRLLVNNAGIDILGNLWELTAAQMSRVVNVNLLGEMHGVRAFAGRMIAAGNPACIANVASIAAFAMLPVQSVYTTTKHAVLAFTECLFLEMQRAAPFIQISAILPGTISTQIFARAQPGAEGSGGDHHRKKMDSMLKEYGITGDEAGSIILRELEAEKFWVCTDPQTTKEAAHERAKYLSALATPELPPRLQALY